MSTRSDIEWTESTWNPLTGCTKISPGCKHCYAERMARRLQAMGQPNYANGFELTLHEHALEAPLSWKKPQMIFVNSMSDLFHRDVPIEFIQQVFRVMRQRVMAHVPGAHQAIRAPAGTQPADRVARQRLDGRQRRDSGLRVSDRPPQTDRRPHQFLSLEPLLGPLPRLDLRGIDWVIVGGESGPGAGRFTRSGCWRFAINARSPAYPSSSSSGAACARSAPDGCWRAVRGTRCRRSSVHEIGVSA